MRLVLSHHTAFEFWLSSLSAYKPEFGYNTSAENLTEIKQESTEAVKSAFETATGTRQTLHLLVPTPSDRFRFPSTHFHVWGDPLPREALICIGHGLYVVSPELCYLQMAQDLHGIELVRAGTDLCSLYSYPYNHWRDTLVEREPIATRESIIAFLDKYSDGRKGAKEARRCAAHIIERTRSPRESTLSCLLASPARLGGQSLSGMEANAQIPLSGESSLLTKRNYLEIDLFWPEQRVGVEYNSHLHDTHEAAYRDLEKITTMLSLDTTIMPINTSHLDNYESFAVIVKTLRNALGLRNQETPSMDKRRREAHRVLLEAEHRWGHNHSLTDQAWWQVLLPALTF